MSLFPSKYERIWVKLCSFRLSRSRRSKSQRNLGLLFDAGGLKKVRIRSGVSKTRAVIGPSRVSLISKAREPREPWLLALTS